MRRLCLIALILLVFSPLSPAAAPPNMVFIFADDLGWGDLSCYGKRGVSTPHLDQLAAEGTLFTQFYVAGSVCSPSRTGIMTGQYPARHRVFGHFATAQLNERRGMPNALDPAVTTLTDLLRRGGYRTGHFGKWHLGNIAPSEYGVDVFRTDRFSNVPDQPPIDIWSASARPTCTRDILDAALEFIRSEPRQPFYVQAWFSDPHATLNPSAEQLERVRQFQPAGVDFAGVAQVYYACVREMDLQVGRFLEELDRLGLSENTLVIFSSDNGPEDFQIRNAAHSGVGDAGPFRGRKRAIYEGGIRVPFLVRWPGHVPAGKVNDTSVVAGVDILPSLCAVAGVEVAGIGELDGEEMSDVLLGSSRLRERALHWEWRYRVFGRPIDQPPRLALRRGDWKLLMNPDRSRVELYDIPQDPMELNNLASLRPDLVEHLASQLLSWNQSLPESPIEPAAGKNDYPFPGGSKTTAR